LQPGATLARRAPRGETGGSAATGPWDGRAKPPRRRRLGDAYEQLNAAFGDFALETLKASTAAIASSDESTYTRIEDAIASLTQRRDALANDIKSQLAAAAFDAQELDEGQAKSEIDQAQELIDQARSLAS
jgi:hypothetical protein